MKLEWTMEDVQEEHERVLQELRDERDFFMAQYNQQCLQQNNLITNLTTALKTEGYSPEFINSLLNGIHQ